MVLRSHRGKLSAKTSGKKSDTLRKKSEKVTTEERKRRTSTFKSIRNFR